MDPRTPKLADETPCGEQGLSDERLRRSDAKPNRLKCGAQKEYEIHCDVHRNEYGLAVGALAMYGNRIDELLGADAAI